MSLRLASTCGILALALGCARGVAAEEDLASKPSIRVSGTGEIAAAPDTAELRIAVVSEAPTAQAAVQANSGEMQRVIATLGKLGIEKQDVQTERFDLSPQYRHDPKRSEPPRIVGYRASNGVRVVVRELGSVGRVLDQIVQAGANEVQGLAFSIGDPKPLLDEARGRAVADARRKAELYARAAGVALGRLLRLEEQGASGPVPMPRMARAEAMVAVPVEPGQLELRADVMAVYAIE